MSVLRLALIVMMLNLASAAPSLAQQDASNDYLIVPRERIGPVRIGMTILELRAAIGDPASTGTLEGARAHHYAYPDQGFVVIVRASDNRVMSVATHSSQYRTVEGLSVGSNIFAIRAALSPVREWLAPGGGYGYVCYSGTDFLYNEHAVVITISIPDTRSRACG